jgi:hypothetical protein
VWRLPISTRDLAPTKSRLDFGFEAQPRNCHRLHLAVLATMRLAREPTLLVFSTLGGLTGNDLSHLFFTCTITGQVATCTYAHTTLSITHHTRKRPSTSPRTTQVLNLPLNECIENKHVLVTKEKRKRKETKRNSNKRSKSKGKAKGKIT